MLPRFPRLLHVAVCVCLLAGWAGGAASRAAAVTAGPCLWQDPVLRGQELRVAHAVWQANVSRRDLVVHPSKAYAGVWLRDSFWTLTALGDVRLSALALARFADRQNHLGQLPTQFTVFVHGPVYKSDESTLLFLIWAAWQVEHGGPRPAAPVLRRALAYVLAQARGGLYRSQQGDYADWFDSYVLRAPDTLSFNQGLYAVALRSAGRLGLSVPQGATAAADAGYRSLIDADGGYLRFSRRLNYHDISGLTGEFLSLWLFKQALLPTAAVRATLATQPPFRSGFEVVTDGSGHYLPPDAFAVHVNPGDYQNGGSWLLYDYLALATGELHHLPGMVAALHDRLAAEFAAGVTFHEYLDTDPQSPLYGGEPAFRDGFSWDTFVTRVDVVLQQRCTAVT